MCFSANQLALVGVLNATMKLPELTRKRCFKIPPHFPCSVEAYSLVVGEMFFVGSLEDADLVIENGIRNLFPVQHLTKPLCSTCSPGGAQGEGRGCPRGEGKC